jgi:hypothetical protein
MTNIEMLMVIKNSASSLEHIKEVAEKIISNTYITNTCDNHINHVNYIDVKEHNVVVDYEYRNRYGWGNDEVTIPIEWFDEKFDYVKAYEEMLRKKEAYRKRAEKARRKRAAEKRKRAKVLKEKKEYNTYLKLKKKYENGENK